jgi:TRAP-type C4-dicarboxylate transport system permease small subunit
MNTLVKNFYKLLLALSGVAMVASLGVIMLGVAARQFLWDIPGLDAYAGYCIAATLFLALPASLRHGDHIRVNMVLQKLSPRVLNIFEYWCLAAATALTHLLCLVCGPHGVAVLCLPRRVARSGRNTAVDSPTLHAAGLHRLCGGFC